METSKDRGKSLKYKFEDEEEDLEKEEDDDDYEDISELGFGEDSRKKRAMTSGSTSNKKGSSGIAGGPAPMPPSCQADDCNTNLSDARPYHKRHKVCEIHFKAAVVVVAGFPQRFCQQCSRFHGLSEFDEAKRSCRRRLAGHNERRRKSLSDLHGGEGST